MLKKTLKYLGFIGLIVFIYFNYIKPEKKIKRAPDPKLVIEGVTYNIGDYTIKSQEQVENLEEKNRSFKKAVVKFKDMEVSGDSAVQKKNKDLTLDGNIIGISQNGWRLESGRLDYRNEDGMIFGSQGIKAENEKEGIIIYGDKITSDLKFKDLNIRENIRVMTKKMELDGNHANYNNDSKILTLNENVRLKGKNLGESGDGVLTGFFETLKYDGNTREVTANEEYTIKYQGVTLKAKQFKYNEDTNNFKVSKDVEFNQGDYSLKVTSLDYIGKEMKLYIRGPIKGGSKKYNIYAKEGYFDQKTGNLVLVGGVRVWNSTMELKGERVVYNSGRSDFRITGSSGVSYSEDTQERKRTGWGKEILYNIKTKDIKMAKGYRYREVYTHGNKTDIYISKGRTLYYNDKTKKGRIERGTFNLSNPEIEGSSNSLTFDLVESKYRFLGNAKVNYSGTELRSDNVLVEDKRKLVTFPLTYNIYNEKQGMKIYGRNGSYNYLKGEVISRGKVKVYQGKRVLTGNRLVYNTNTKKGTLGGPVLVKTERGETLRGDKGEFTYGKEVNLIGNLVARGKDVEISGDKGRYTFEDKKIKIPGKIKVSSSHGKGQLYDGEYDLERKEVQGFNFTGEGSGIKGSGDKVRYNLQKNLIILSGNTKISNKAIEFIGEEGRYSTRSGEIETRKDYIIRNKVYNYTMSGKTLKGNIFHETYNGKKIKLKLNSGETVSGDYFKGNMKTKELSLSGNVKGVGYIVDKKTLEKSLVKIRGDTVKIFLYNDKNNKNELTMSRGEIKGNGIYDYQDMEVLSDFLEIDFVKKNVFGRDGVKMRKGTEIKVESELMTLNMFTQSAKLTNNVKFQNKDKNGKIIKGESDRGTFNNKTQIATLEGNVKAEASGKVIMSNYLKYNLETGILNAKGNVRVDYK